MLVLGTSITAGVGLQGQKAFPALLQQNLYDAGYRSRVTARGVPGLTAREALKLLEHLKHEPADIVVLELGAIEALRQMPVSRIRDGLAALIDSVRSTWPSARVVLTTLGVPHEAQPDYALSLEGKLRRLALEKETAVAPEILEGVIGVPEMNLSDGLHPNGKGHQRIASKIWPIIRAMLQDEC